MVSESHNWQAPGRLELVRVFLDSGRPAREGGGDRLAALRASAPAWAAAFPGVARPAAGQLAQLTELRERLGALLGGPPAAPAAAWLSAWFERTGLHPVAAAEGGALAVRLAAPPRAGLAGALAEAVAAALADGTWARLRRCPDCQLVFFDRTRNASKVWCGMYAGPDGRACGTIAKVRRYRARRAAED